MAPFEKEELTPRQAQELRWIYENHANVRHFHAVKEELRAVYEAKDRQEAAVFLDRISFNTQDASDVAMVQWGRTLKAWREAIQAFHGLRITKGFTEGTPTKIKLLKRLRYGFRNAETYIRKMMLLGLLPGFLLELAPHLLACRAGQGLTAPR
ncbi:MAG: transposase [Clostridiales bacterium]|nr:transposase [Clostridiales bacterium]MBT9259665.1 transposase [Clostridiales bacterium]